VLVFLALLGLAVACASTTDPPRTANGDIDTDGDGFADIDEEEAGSDPEDEFDTPDGGTDDETDEPADDGADEPADDGADDGVDGCSADTTEPCVTDLADQTCHNFDDAGAASDDRVTGQLFGVGGPGNLVLSFEVLEGAPAGAPTERDAQGAYNAGGQFVALVPLFAPGERLHLTGVTVESLTLDPAALPDFTFVVAPLDDPTTECQPLQ
jgi:hypothetical protein